LKNRFTKYGLLAGTLGALLFAAACSTATPEAGGQPSSGGFDYTTIILLVAMVGGFYFLMIRPQQKRQKEQRNLLESLNKGDKVITAGGIFGTIESVEEETMVVRIESGATMRILKNSVMVKREN
jgi:preprotein translocase subunit YajC